METNPKNSRADVGAAKGRCPVIQIKVRGLFTQPPLVPERSRRDVNDPQQRADLVTLKGASYGKPHQSHGSAREELEDSVLASLAGRACVAAALAELLSTPAVPVMGAALSRSGTKSETSRGLVSGPYVGAQIRAAHGAFAFLVQHAHERAVERWLSGESLAQIANGGAATLGVFGLLWRREGCEI